MSENIVIPFFEDDDDNLEDENCLDYCTTCGCSLDDHPINCPDNYSPYAEFIRNGYG